MLFFKTKLVALPSKSVTPIGCKWIFKIKYNADNTFQHHKTRLVVKDSINNKPLITNYCETCNPDYQINYILHIFNSCY